MPAVAAFFNCNYEVLLKYSIVTMCNLFHNGMGGEGRLANKYSFVLALETSFLFLGFGTILAKRV